MDINELKEFLKDNLTVEIEIDCEGGYKRVIVKLQLEKETISSDSFSV